MKLAIAFATIFAFTSTSFAEECWLGQESQITAVFDARYSGVSTQALAGYAIPIAIPPMWITRPTSFKEVMGFGPGSEIRKIHVALCKGG